MSKNKNMKLKNGLPVKEEAVKESTVVNEDVTNAQVEENVSVEEDVVINGNEGGEQSSSEAVSGDSKKESKEQQKVKSDVKKDNKNAKGKKKANANNTEKRTLAQKTKATVSELKKVTWPTFGQTVKQTGVVIGFVLIFIVILLGLNSLFGWLFNLIIDALA